jgi:hypothetical protein
MAWFSSGADAPVATDAQGPGLSFAWPGSDPVTGGVDARGGIHAFLLYVGSAALLALCIAYVCTWLALHTGKMVQEMGSVVWASVRSTLVLTVASVVGWALIQAFKSSGHLHNVCALPWLSHVRPVCEVVTGKFL